MSDHAYIVQARLSGADYRVELDDGAGHAWAGDEPADLGAATARPRRTTSCSAASAPAPPSR
jgi:hypothetical protein